MYIIYTISLLRMEDYRFCSRKRARPPLEREIGEQRAEGRNKRAPRKQCGARGNNIRQCRDIAGGSLKWLFQWAALLVRSHFYCCELSLLSRPYQFLKELC